MLLKIEIFLYGKEVLEDCCDDQPSIKEKYITGGGTVALTVSLLVLHKSIIIQGGNHYGNHRKESR